jgi:hypothetical protein
MIVITTNTERQPRKCSNNIPNGAPAQRAVKCPETTIESHVPLRFSGAISPMIAYIKGVIEATDKPAKIRLTMSYKCEAKAVSALEITNSNKPNVINFLRPFLSESHPNKGAEKAYVTAKTVTIHPVVVGLTLYALEMNGNNGDTTNKSVPIRNKVIQLTLKLTLPCNSKHPPISKIIFTCIFSRGYK